MKSYFLEELDDDVAARKALTEELPRQKGPWFLRAPSGCEGIAYLYVDEGGEGETRGPLVIQADISGRHYYEDQKVIDVLCRLQQRFGGVVRNGNDEVVR